MQSLTFMEAKLGRLCKTVRPDAIEPYPMAAQFRSHLEAVATPENLLDALRRHAAAGHCLHVGNLTNQLTDWGRRAGLADRSGLLQWIVIDVDKLEMRELPTTWDEQALADVAERVVAYLNHPALDGVSYVAQAATKLGLVPNHVSLHLFFLLAAPVRSHEAKDWLKRLNFNNDNIRRAIRLSANGFALTYPIDISCADTARLIYLAAPNFVGLTDPFANPDSRFTLVSKQRPRLDLLGDQLQISRQITNIEQTERRVKRDLRAAAGLNPGEQERIRSTNIHGQNVELLTNPNRGTLIYVSQRTTPPTREGDKPRTFLYYNLNDGDSAAYYHEAGRPELILNFKGEPAFRWADVDPESYERYCAENAILIAQADPINVFMVINQLDDRIYKVWHDHGRDAVTVVQSSREQIKDFYAEYGKVEPTFLPTWQIAFSPDNNTRVDYVDKTINQFNPTKYMKQHDNLIGNVADMLCIGANELWKTLCPNTWMLIDHVSGNASAEEQDLFINWLAFIWQRRRKAQTAWIFQGEEGTGKGTLFDKIIEPLFGVQNTTMRTNHIFNDGFDSWRAKALIIALDEFELPANNSSDAALAKLRNWITEERTAVRAMRKVAEDTPLYDNYLMFSNRHNILRIPEGDRRFNIFPRQERRLNTICDTKALYDALDDELDLFANVLHFWQVDENRAMTAHMNHAKLTARAAGFTTTDEFALALKHGDIEFFAQVFDVTPHMNALAENQMARAAVTRAILHLNETVFITTAEMTAIYNALNDGRMNAMHFGKMISRHGIEAIRANVDSRRQRGYSVTFHADTQTVESLQAYVRRQMDQQFSVIQGART